MARTLYHTTERYAAVDILENGFTGSYASLGDGVYFYETVESAIRFAKKKGWDGRLVDPVVLAVRDEGPYKIMPSDIGATQDYRVYADVWMMDLEEGSDERFKPEVLWIAIEEPLKRNPEIMSDPPMDIAPAMSR